LANKLQSTGAAAWGGETAAAVGFGAALAPAAGFATSEVAGGGSVEPFVWLSPFAEVGLTDVETPSDVKFGGFVTLALSESNSLLKEAIEFSTALLSSFVSIEPAVA